jgi:histidine triad (HIT) family protein
MAFVDLRQFHPGHVLVIPRKHFNDVRDLDEHTGAALMSTVARITRAVAKAFPNEGLSLWHSIGEAAFQEVLHLHIHIHPRTRGDNFLRVYPNELPIEIDDKTRGEIGARIREHLSSSLYRARNERGNFGQIAEQIVRFVFVFARIDKAAIGNCRDAHLRGLRGGDTGK